MNQEIRYTFFAAHSTCCKGAICGKVVENVFDMFGDLGLPASYVSFEPLGGSLKTVTPRGFFKDLSWKDRYYSSFGASSKKKGQKKGDYHPFGFYLHTNIESPELSTMYLYLDEAALSIRISDLSTYFEAYFSELKFRYGYADTLSSGVHPSFFVRGNRDLRHHSREDGLHSYDAERDLRWTNDRRFEYSFLRDRIRRVFRTNYVHEDVAKRVFSDLEVEINKKCLNNGVKKIDIEPEYVMPLDLFLQSSGRLI